MKCADNLKARTTALWAGDRIGWKLPFLRVFPIYALGLETMATHLA